MIQRSLLVVCLACAVLASPSFAQGRSGKTTAAVASCADCVTLHQASVTLSDDQIRHLPSTAVDVVAAPGADRVIVPVSAFLVLDTTAGPYSSDPGASWLFQYEGGGYATSIAPIAGVINTQRVSQYLFPTAPYQSEAVFFGSNSVIGNGLIGYPSSSINLKLQIKDDWNGVADYAGGHPANTLKISVVYMIFNAAAGQFE